MDHHGHFLKRLVLRIGKLHRRLRLFPFGFGNLLRLVREDKCAQLVADDEIRPAVPIHIAGADLAADSRVVVNQMGHPVHLAAVAHELEPVEHALLARPGGHRRTMRPVTIAGDDVLEAVAIHIEQLHRMQLGKAHAITVLLRLLVHEHMRAPRRRACGILLRQLLVPGQTITMRRQRRNHICAAITIDVVGIHLCRRGGEIDLVVFPDGIAFQ